MLKDAGPSVPVEIIGLAEVPAAGDEFNAVEDERMARELAEQRKSREKEASFKSNATVSLDDLFAQISEGAKELKHHRQGGCRRLCRGRKELARKAVE